MNRHHLKKDIQTLNIMIIDDQKEKFAQYERITITDPHMFTDPICIKTPKAQQGICATKNTTAIR